MAANHSLSTIVEAVLAAEVANSGVIGVNFSAGAWPIPSKTGGAFWNNLTGGSGTAMLLRDSEGNETTARLAFASTEAYSQFVAPKTANAVINRLYRGGLIGNDTIREVTVHLTDIPYPLYDVFVFTSAGSGDRSTLSITDRRTTFYYRSAGRDDGELSRLIRTRSEDPSAPTEGPWQYQVFPARTDPAFTVTTAGSRHCVLSNNVFGLQIVQAIPGKEEVMAIARTTTEPSFRRGNSIGAADQPPRSELHIPFGMGSVIRVRYRGAGPDGRLGGGAINIYSGPDIALHVNPRPQLNVLVLNSHIHGGWGGEERPDGFPLEETGEICLSVWAGPDGFYIQASPTEGLTPFSYRYAYRLPEERVLDRITIDLPDVRAISVQPEL